MKKRFFSLVLALMLCLSLAPMAALAASDEPTGEIAEETVAEPTGEIAEPTGEIVEPTPEPEEAMPLALEGDGQSTPIAEVTTDSGSYNISDSGALLDALEDYRTTRVKLLQDVTATHSSGLIVKSSELTLDLNGQALEIRAQQNVSEIYIGEERYSYNTIYATLTITDSSTAGKGSLFANCDIKVASGSTLNINRGSLSVVKSSGGSIVVEGAMKVSGSASVNSIFVYGAKASLAVTGGEINNVYICGGRVSLSGGMFGCVRVDDTIDFTDCLADGYAFYSKPASGESDEYTELATPTKDTDYQFVTFVQVKEHTCSLVPQGNGTYSCAGCGRTGLKDAVEYLDENGDEKECIKYTVVGSDNESINLSSGWYVVQGDVTIDGAVTIPEGNAVHLILCDNAKLTINGGSSGIGGDGSLTVYGQSGGTGALNAKSTNRSRVSQVADCYGIKVDTLTVNGGSVTATGGNATSEGDKAYSYGIKVDTLTVNGGSVTGIGGSATGTSLAESCGIYALQMTTNGQITAKGGDATATGGRAYSEGVVTAGVTVSDGAVLEATGGAVRASYEGTSCGIAVYYYSDDESGVITVNGTVNATSGAATASSFARSYGVYAENVIVNKGEITANGVEATVGGLGDSGSYGIYVGDDFTVTNGGTVTATTAGTPGEDYDIYVYFDFALDGGTVKSGREGGAVRVFAVTLEVSGGTMKLAEGSSLYGVEVSDGVALGDLLSDGCAYWQTVTGNGVMSLPTIMTLGGLTELVYDYDWHTYSGHIYYVMPCTHSTTEGVCAHCGKDFTPAPTAKPKAPNTGDEANVVLWLALATVSMACVAVVRRKKVK